MSDEEGIPANELQELSMQDPAYRTEWERARLAHEVAMRVIRYRIDNGLTQSELAERVGMRQPHVARLEAGDHEPSLATLARLSRSMGLEFHIDITLGRLEISAA